MSKIGIPCVLAGLSMLGFLPGTAQTAKDASPTLKMVVVLTRHGVRSPTWTQARLDASSSLPWPQWSVPPGNLTARGHKLLTLFGGYDRELFAKAGLLPASGCGESDSTYLWADTDQRTLESGQSLAEGIAPGCGLTIHSRAGGGNDSLFHPAAMGVKPDQADAAFAQLDQRVQQQKDTAQRDELIGEINHLLQGCEPKAACKPAKAPLTALPGDATATTRGKGDHIVDLQGSLPTASTIAEDFLLEYADGMPMSSVGWGHVDETTLRRLLALHTDYFDLMHRTPALAQIEASNMLFHIEQTLQQGVGGRLVAGAIGPVGSKIVFIVGHDTNLAGIAQLLGLHWTLDGRTDDTPPGTQLAFELWQDASGAFSVQINVAAQTLLQMRGMQKLSLSTPPAHQVIVPQACAAGGRGCSWSDFKHIAETAIDPRAVIAQKPE